MRINVYGPQTLPINVMGDFSLQSFGKRIRQIRLEAGFDGRDDDHSMRAFCRKFGENATAWSELERAVKQVYVTGLAKLCKKYNRSPTWLLYGQGHEYLSNGKSRKHCQRKRRISR